MFAWANESLDKSCIDPGALISGRGDGYLDLEDFKSDKPMGLAQVNNVVRPGGTADGGAGGDWDTWAVERMDLSEPCGYAADPYGEFNWSVPSSAGCAGKAWPCVPSSCVFRVIRAGSPPFSTGEKF